MRIAIIGPGGMGGGIGRLLARAGHEVVFSGSRSPEKLAHAAELAGPAARLIADANFVPVDAGGLADASILEPTSTKDVLPVLTEPEARRLLGEPVMLSEERKGSGGG